MKTIRTDYNLQEITQKADAYLSDLFILLYSMFLIEKSGSVPSRYSLNKLFPFIFDKLEGEGKLEDLRIFNLPFYKMQGGHFNKSLKQRYLKKLEEAGLIEPRGQASYKLTRRSTELMQQFYREEGRRVESREFEDLVNEYCQRFLKGRNYNEILSLLRAFSHTLLVEDNGEKVSVDALEIDDYKAISYNGKDFKEGKRSNLIPPQYLTLLAYELQRNQEVDREDLKTVDSLLSRYASAA